MSRSAYALGIDVGTSGVRAVIIDERSVVVAQASTPMSDVGANLRAPSVWRETLARTLSAMHDAMSQTKPSAVTVDATSGTVLALDSQGRAVGDALMYNDAVSDPRIIDMIDSIAPATSAVRGSGSGLARACQLQTRPGVSRIVHQADWVAELLARAPVQSDESNALKTGYDPVGRCWPAWLTNDVLRTELLPPVVATGTQTGLTSGAFGLPVDVPVVAGLTDGCAAFLATGATQPGEGVTSLGTTLTIKLFSNAPIFAPEYGIYSHRIGDMWLAGGASNSGGAALASHFSIADIERLAPQINANIDSGYDYYPLPGIGERFPINDPKMRSRVSPRPADDAAFLHGLLEGVARIEQLGFERLSELGAPRLSSLRTVGGGANNTAWTAIRRHQIGVDFAPSLNTAAAAGAARVAMGYLKRNS